MRVTIVQPALPSYRLGLFQRLAERLGSEFAVYSSTPDGFGVLMGARARTDWQRDLGPLRPILPGLEWQKDALSVPISRGDVLVVCGAPRTLSTLALILKGRMSGAHTIWWGHYWSASSKPWRAALRFALMRLSEAIMFYTDREVAEYRAREGRRVRKKICALNNGIETSDIETLRSPYIPSERARDLVFIGRITEKAELDLLLKALARPSCKAVTLDVIGDGGGAAELKQFAVELGISDRITWQGATVDEARIAEIVNRCKVFVYPGSVGLSLVHGLAYGLPAIVHDDRWTHMPEIAALEQGGNGVTFRKGDEDDLAKKICEMLQNEGEMQTMSAAAINTTSKSFNAADMAERFIAMIDVLIDTKSDSENGAKC